MKCFVLFHSDQFFGLLDDVIVSQANRDVPNSKAPANKRSAGRFQRKISFTAVVLLNASMTNRLAQGGFKRCEKYK